MRFIFTCWLVFQLLVIAGCKEGIAPSEKYPVRMGMVTGIKPDKIAYYKELHAKAWPGVLKRIEASNIRNYSIYLKQIGNEYFLFSYFEYIGDDYAADMKKIADDSTTRRWWKETDPCQLPFPEAIESGKIWADMEEVFHAD